MKTVHSPILATALALAAIGAAGCGKADRPAAWAYISPVILQPNCATGSCHGPASAAAGLDFSDPDRGYTSLMRLWVWVVDRTKGNEPGCGVADGTVVCEKLFRPLVTPYDPAESRLVNVLRARNATRMPPDRPLDEADIRLIENWILNGAKKSETDVADAATDAFSVIDAGAPDGGGGADAASDADGGAPDQGGHADAPADTTADAAEGGARG